MEKFNLNKFVNELENSTSLKTKVVEYEDSTTVHVLPNEYETIWTIQIRKIDNICNKYKKVWYIDFDIKCINIPI